METARKTSQDLSTTLKMMTLPENLTTTWTAKMTSKVAQVLQTITQPREEREKKMETKKAISMTRNDQSLHL